MRLLLISAAVATIASAVPGLADTAPSAMSHVMHVSIDNYTFKPATVTIQAGTTVTWKNLDDDPHTATADGGAFDSKGLAQGDSFSYTFTKPGTYEYHCSVHPFMKATIVVQGTTSDAATPRQALEDLPLPIELFLLPLNHQSKPEVS